MTENKALALDVVVGCLLSWGSVILLDAVGANDGLQFLAGMWGLVVTAFMVGVIGYLYERKEAGREDGGDH
jgi:hypothetical protein